MRDPQSSLDPGGLAWLRARAMTLEEAFHPPCSFKVALDNSGGNDRGGCHCLWTNSLVSVGFLQLPEIGHTASLLSSL